MFQMFSARLALTAMAAAVVTAMATIAPSVQAQSEPAASAPKAAKSDHSNKADKPGVEAAASQANVATKKPAKSGAQAGAQAGSAAASPPKPY